jgi:hypothetical protein
MTTQPKTNDNKAIEAFDNIFLPLPPLDGADYMELEVYARFMRHYRLVPNSRPEIKILSGIQFTSDMMDLSDAVVSKMLADMGLRAPRRAFPESYLEHVDASLMRSGWDVGGPCASSIDMKRFWDDIGEDKFAAYRRKYALIDEMVGL